MPPDHSPPRHMHRFRRAHDLADRPADDATALLRKARAVFMLRARQFASEARWQVKKDRQALCRRWAICELQAARQMHRLVMARILTDRLLLPDGAAS